MMRTTLAGKDLSAIFDPLADANAAITAEFPGDSGRRQPVTRCMAARTCSRPRRGKSGCDRVKGASQTYAGSPPELAEATGMPAGMAETVYARVVEKLQSRAYRRLPLDFEDGYGYRPDAERIDTHFRRPNKSPGDSPRGACHPSSEIRSKPLTEVLYARASGQSIYS